MPVVVRPHAAQPDCPVPSRAESGNNLQEKRIDAHGDLVPFERIAAVQGFCPQDHDGGRNQEHRLPRAWWCARPLARSIGDVVAYIEALDGGERLDAARIRR